MDDVAKVRAALERANQARKSLRTVRLRVQQRIVTGTTHTREFSLSFARPDSLRLIEKDNRSSLLLNHQGVSHFRPGSISSGPREEETLAFCLKKFGFLHASLGQALEGKPVALPRGATEVRLLPADNPSREDRVGWINPDTGAAVDLVLSRVTGLPLAERAIYRTRRGTVFAELFESYTPTEINGSIPRSFFEAVLPMPGHPTVKPLQTIPTRTTLDAGIRKLLDDSVAATQKIRSLSGLRIGVIPFQEVTLEEVALELPGKLSRWTRLGKRRQTYVSNGIRETNFENPPLFQSTSLSKGQDPAAQFLKQWFLLPLSLALGLEENRNWSPTSPGRLVGAVTIGDALCDRVELQGVFAHDAGVFPCTLSLAIRRSDLLLHSSAIKVVGLGDSQLHTFFADLDVNPRLPASTFTVPSKG